MRKHPIGAEQVQSFVESVVGDDMHAKRVLSVANATLGVIHAASLAVSTIGRSLAQARGLEPRHRVPVPGGCPAPVWSGASSQLWPNR